MAAERLVNRSRAQQLEFVKTIWPSISDDAFQHEDYTRLFRYIDREMNKTREYPARYSKHSVDEVAEYIRFLRENLMHSKAQAIADNQFPQKINDNVLSRTLDLAASVWLTTRVDTEVASGCVTWKSNMTLQESIQPHFGSVAVVDDTKRDIIPRSLTVAHLCKNYGFTVNWTDDLRHHLNVDWENQRITVYEHLIYLCNHLNYPAATAIPISILEEAVDTINLLFPSDQKRTKKFLRDEHKTFNRLGYCGRERRMRLSDYRHWRERVRILKEALDDPPKGYHQLVLDKEHRNFLNWATFWIAFIVALLTIISIVFGVVGIVFAVFSYDISLKSYQVSVDSLDAGIKQLEIAIAMACADAEVASRLPQYCSRS
ncbi:hypothetical protein NUW58_g7069 [Xylaria curta]|uniref:Uncharacterized protein n=1 Tax=Xylaria curta TaxID=42375 RepID=A0ACC1NM29_9PEZI|nr:hypothetical protein NUW58_g7069 [Xylaria curta]